MYLVLANTNKRGAGWPLGERPLVIGRGDGCDVRISDPCISRRHVQVWLDAGAPRFEDLGSSHGILLNGRPVHAGQLRPGDTLAVGTILLQISRMAPVSEARTATEGPDTPITLAINKGYYAQSFSEKRLLKASPRTIHELHDLYQLGLRLGAVEGTADLVDTLLDALTAQFSPKACWVALSQPGRAEPYFHSGAPGEALPPAVRELAARALDTREGLIAPQSRREAGGRVFQTLLAAPMAHVDGSLGCILLHGESPGRTYTEDDLHLALGMATLTAPHVLAARHFEQLRRENRELRETVGVADHLLGDTPAMRHLRGQLRTAAAADALNVLLLGETGTGKEIAARRVHLDSPRRDAPFVVINCAAIPGELFESEIFGHERGAFTGAAQRRIGRLEEADGGTLFLDEIGDLAPENQARILRAIETGTFHRVGGSNLVRVNVRFVSATNKGLEPHLFREDLLHRLNGVTLRMPPLRDRAGDIPLLARHFLDLANQTGHHAPIREIAPDAIQALATLPWPGNVRQLRASVLRAAAFALGPVLRAEDFEDLRPAVQNTDNTPVQNSDAIGTEILVSLSEAERRHIQAVLQACHGNVSAAAKILGISRGTVYKWVGQARHGDMA